MIRARDIRQAQRLKEATETGQRMRPETDIRCILEIITAERPLSWSPAETIAVADALRWVLGDAMEIREAWLAKSLAARREATEATSE